MEPQTIDEIVSKSKEGDLRSLQEQFPHVPIANISEAYDLAVENQREARILQYVPIFIVRDTKKYLRENYPTSQE